MVSLLFGSDISCFSVIESLHSLLMTSHQIVERAGMYVVGISCRTSNSLTGAFRDIPNHWKRFLKERIADQIPDKLSDNIIALYCDYEGNHTQHYSLVLGCQVSSLGNLPSGMVGKTVCGGRYAQFHVVGELPQALISTWAKIWQQPDLQRTYTGDYEVYQEQASEGPKRVDLYIATA